MHKDLSDSALGKDTTYISEYTPSLLFAIPRQANRGFIGIDNNTVLPFKGVDFWRAYELSWLDLGGKPINAILNLSIPANSLNLIESKSMKLYFNSFNQSKFSSHSLVLATIKADLSNSLQLVPGTEIDLAIIIPPNVNSSVNLTTPLGDNIDHLAITTDIYSVTPELLSLKKSATFVTEILYSNLLRSNCPITNQPDWATVSIEYTGLEIDRESLLKYIISFRQHNEFHEQCVERIFIDLHEQCKPASLTVLAQFTRRGGIEINPLRSNHPGLLKAGARTFFQ